RPHAVLALMPSMQDAARRRWVLVSGLAVVLILAAGAWTTLRWREAEAAARVPASPAGAGECNAVAGPPAARHQAAGSQPSSPAAVGALCVAYHADMFFDAADRCYALVSELDSSQWRWRYYRALIQAERGGGEMLVDTLRRVVNQASDSGPAWQ